MNERRRDAPIFDAVLKALIDQHWTHSHGGGMIGKAGAVIEALGLDGDRPLSSVRQRPKRKIAS